jgi:hypothetical protein
MLENILTLSLVSNYLKEILSPQASLIIKKTIMQKSRQISLFITITLWAIIIGGISYSHVVYFPPYLSHLPESNRLITGEYGLHDENFWMLVHPLAILFTIIPLILSKIRLLPQQFIKRKFDTICASAACDINY